MSESTLVPERQLVFSPSLAATIGLEEAILLQQLQSLFEHRPSQLRAGFNWLSVERDFLLRSLPFWDAIALHRITRSLVDKGVLLVESPPLHSADRLLFALNESPREVRAPAPIPEPAAMAATAPAAAATAAAAHAPAPRSAALLPSHWRPSEDLLQLMALNHNIPRQFALDQLEDFVFYWRERGETHHAWENKFRQHVTGAWRRAQRADNTSFRTEPPPLDEHWQPSADALEILLRADVERSFIEEAIPEFVLYWRERGDAPKELNSRFIQHIRSQWARYSSSLAHGGDPLPLPADWRPSADLFDILRLSHIDPDFAQAVLPEFIVYWRDSGQAHTSWNSKFLQHVKYHWAKRHQLTGSTQHGGQQGSHPTSRTRDRSLAQDLTDTSWAD
ncbi:MAG: DnaT-like ssDNA-binding domain-containing protein [Pseudomonadota bacterium]